MKQRYGDAASHALTLGSSIFILLPTMFFPPNSTCAPHKSEFAPHKSGFALPKSNLELVNSFLESTKVPEN